EKDQPSPAGDRVVKGGRELCQLPRPPDERHVWLGRAPAMQVEGGILAEDPLLEVAQLLAWLDPQLVDEGAAGGLVPLERFGLPAGAVERDEQLPDHPLARGVVAAERLEFSHELGVTARDEVGVDPILERREADVLE